jgi:L-ribulose-5-phosphate 3-epimerase
MTVRTTRREFLHGIGITAAAASLPSIPGHASMDPPMKSPFRIAVINDEITQDFGRACEVASKEFGMEWIELRGMWNKNLAASWKNTNCA